MGRRGSGDSQSKTEQSMPSISDHSSEKGESTSQLHELAVDDSIVDRKVIEKLLKKSCYKVTTVDSGRRALEFLGLGDDQNVVNDLQVNMTITDYCMPGMSGHDLLKRVKESSKLKEIPVVVMSSENEASRKRRSKMSGRRRRRVHSEARADRRRKTTQKLSVELTRKAGVAQLGF